MSENIATGEEVKVVEEGGTKSPAPADTQAEPTNDPSDITSSKRWKRNRRRGKLHKRQLENADAEEVPHGSKASKHSADSPSEDSKSIGREILEETDYYFENGLRKVYPYVYTYLCYCKQRWKGKTILEMLNDEFFVLSSEGNERHIESGNVKVNGKQIKSNHILRAKNELISNRTHRHELPVVESPLTIVEDNENYLVIDKPSSIPVHPCGRYRHNSVIYILAKEYNMNNLRIVYRLDRLTSGLLILGKNHRATNKLIDDIRERRTVKTYLCKVEGKFPDGEIECKQPLSQVHHKIGTWCVKPGGKESYTTFQRVSYNGEDNTSIVKCCPHTGRTHQIRVHLQYLGYPITNDPLYNGTVWGPEKGKGGRFHKTPEQLYEDLVASHAAHIYESSGAEPAAPSDTETTPQSLNLQQQSAHQLRLTPDPNCDWCKKHYRDPQPDQLVMYLHALSYQGPDWKYSTQPPLWAQ